MILTVHRNNKQTLFVWMRNLIWLVESIGIIYLEVIKLSKKQSLWDVSSSRGIQDNLACDSMIKLSTGAAFVQHWNRNACMLLVQSPSIPFSPLGTSVQGLMKEPLVSVSLFKGHTTGTSSVSWWIFNFICCQEGRHLFCVNWHIYPHKWRVILFETSCWLLHNLWLFLFEINHWLTHRSRLIDPVSNKFVDCLTGEDWSILVKTGRWLHTSLVAVYMIDECYLHPPTAFIAAQVIFRPARRQCTLPLSIACMYPFKEKSQIGLFIQHISLQNKSTRSN